MTRRELLIVNANVLTMDDNRPRAEALLVRDDRIAMVGTVAEVEVEADEDAVRLDLEGMTVVPGFVDSHVHFISLGLTRMRIDLAGTESLAAALRETKDALPSTGGEWVLAVDFDESLWPEGRLPTREELDIVAGDRPVILRRVCGHIAVANSEALARMGEDVQNVDRETGVLLEEAVLDINRLVRPTPEELEQAFALATESCQKLGITSVHDMASLEHMELYRDLRERGTPFGVRLYVSVVHRHLDRLIALGARSGDGDEFLRTGGVKVFTDGSIGARTAALSTPYADDGSTCGMLNLEDAELERVVGAAAKNGIQVVAHAIGDRAIAQALDALREVTGAVTQTVTSGNNPLRHRLEHVETATREQIGEIARLGIIASMQPNFTGNWSGPGGLNETRLGKDRWRTCNAYGTFHEAGVRVAFGSDCMPLGPTYGIHSAVNHPVESERLDVLAALKMYTANGAYASFEEDLKGTITEGKLADLAVLSKDPTATSNIAGLDVVMTVLGGKIVHDARQGPSCRPAVGGP